MYDQFGFYSENGFAGGGPGGAGGAAARSPTWISAASISPISVRRRGRGRRRTRPHRNRAAVSATSSPSSSAAAAAPQQPEPEKGGDLEYVMDIDFWQAIRGTQARLNITRYEVCDTCHGIGLDAARAKSPARSARAPATSPRWPAP